jgi:Ni/Co efflux regulator RcnB
MRPVDGIDASGRVVAAVRTSSGGRIMQSRPLGVLVLAGVLAAAGAACAGPPRAGDKGRQQVTHVHISDHHRVVVREYYYVEERRWRKCPPGLAKKRNGCMPPGHAKKWKMGRPLPQHVVYYELPPALVVKLGEPPPGHRYVRVAGDILLIAVGTSMVVGAIENLGRM